MRARMAIQFPPRQAVHVGDGSGRDHWLRFLTRNRYQLIGATLFAIILPAAVRKGFDINLPMLGSMENTVAGTFLAMLLGTYLLRRITAYPGVSTVSTPPEDYVLTLVVTR